MGFIRIHDLQETVFLCLCIFLRWFIALMRFSKGFLIPHQRVRTTYLEVNLVTLVIKCCITNYPKTYQCNTANIYHLTGDKDKELRRGLAKWLGSGSLVILQSRSQMGCYHLKAWLGLEHLLPIIWFVHTAVGRRPHSLLAVGRRPPFLVMWTSPLGCLREYPHNMAAGFLQRKWAGERARKKPQYLL